MPRAAACMGGIVLIGRELYRFGYMTKEGPSSKIREAGALPLNAAEFLLICSVGGFCLKRWTGGFFSRRKFVRKFTHTHYDVRLAEVEKELGWAKKGFGPKKPSMLPMHPKIMEAMADKRSIAAKETMTPSELKK